MTDEPFYMWKHWRDRKGLQEAMRDYYPDTLKNNLRIRMAMEQIRVATIVINAEFEELAGEQGDENS